jgi:hypothetical protein
MPTIAATCKNNSGSTAQHQATVSNTYTVLCDNPALHSVLTLMDTPPHCELVQMLSLHPGACET